MYVSFIYGIIQFGPKTGLDPVKMITYHSVETKSHSYSHTNAFTPLPPYKRG